MNTTETYAEVVAPLVLREQLNSPSGGEPISGDQRFVEWTTYVRDVYRCEVHLQTEEEGGFSVYVPTLPGVVSEGEDEHEALDNIREALSAALESCRDMGQPIPWEEAEPTEEAAPLRRWVVVHV